MAADLTFSAITATMPNWTTVAMDPVLVTDMVGDILQAVAVAEVSYGSGGGGSIRPASGFLYPRGDS